MEAGTHKAKLMEVGLEEGKNPGEPHPYMVFATEHGEIKWRGGMSTAKSQEYTVKQLCAAGFIGNGLDDLAHPNALMAFFTPKELEVVVEKSDKGYWNVKFVNEPGSKVKKFAGLVANSYKDVFAKVKAKSGKPVTGVAKPSQEESPF